VPFYAYQPDIQGWRILNDDDEDGDGAMGDGMQQRWRWTMMTMRSMATA